MREKIRVLFLAADPFRTRERLWLEEEVRAIDHAIRKGSARDALELVPHLATRTGDLQDALMLHRPQVVHFAGHGAASGGIYLGDRYGRPQRVGKEALGNLFGILQGSIRVVVLNGCDTLSTVEVLREVVDYAIGMNRPVGDEAATDFAAAFYGALAMGETVATSFALGVSRLELEGNPDAKAPVLLVRPGVDPDAVLVEKPNPNEGVPDPTRGPRQVARFNDEVDLEGDATFEAGQGGPGAGGAAPEQIAEFRGRFKARNMNFRLR